MDGTASYRMEYSGPVTVPAAAVVAVGDRILAHAQSFPVGSQAIFGEVSYQYKSVGPIEVTTHLIESPLSSIPTLSSWGVLVITAVILIVGVLLTRGRQGRGKLTSESVDR